MGPCVRRDDERGLTVIAATTQRTLMIVATIQRSCAAPSLPVSSFEINVSQMLRNEAEISSRRATTRDSHSRHAQWNQSKRFADEYLAGKFFDQKNCSPLRDVVRSNKRRGPSLIALNTARHARDTMPRTATGSMGEENEDDDFDDCRISADCLVNGSVRSGCRTAKQSSPSRSRQRAIPRHQRLCGAGGVGRVGLQLRWWRIGTGRALIFSLVCSADIPKGRAGRRCPALFFFGPRRR
jgi:hypothetical protein